jgi:hypothetical protein
VAFSIPNAPLDTTVDPSGTSDKNGLVTVNVNAGKAIGAFTVKAVVIPDQVEATSNTIGIRGAKPSNFGFTLQCLPVNVPAYVSSDQKLAQIKIPCTVKLVDRFNNPVGTGTSVGFMSEAGSIPKAAATQKYQFGSANTDEGVGTVTFDTLADTRPKDVVPFPVDPDQFPFERAAEPSVNPGALTNNPRDSLVTIIAFVRGEEHYWDLNQNGVYDLGEPFIDQGEPFIDENDDGMHDATEPYIDSDHNLMYTEGDGKWSDDTTIWTEAQILYTGLPATLAGISDAPDLPTGIDGLGVTGLLNSPFASSCGGGVAEGDFRVLGGWTSDAFLNVPTGGTTFAFSNLCANGSFSSDPHGTMLDGYGFEMERKLLTSQGKTLCNSAPIDPQDPTKWDFCVWKRLFGRFAGAVGAGTATIKASNVGANKACASCSVNLDVTVPTAGGSVKVPFKSFGGVH